MHMIKLVVIVILSITGKGPNGKIDSYVIKTRKQFFLKIIFSRKKFFFIFYPLENTIHVAVLKNIDFNRFLEKGPVYNVIIISKRSFDFQTRMYTSYLALGFIYKCQYWHREIWVQMVCSYSYGYGFSFFLFWL